MEGEPVPGQLAVYDLTGRIVRTLFRSGEDIFLWDGAPPMGMHCLLEPTSSKELPQAGWPR